MNNCFEIVNNNDFFLNNSVTNVSLFGVNICLWVLVFGSVLAVIVFFTSRTDRPPKYQLVCILS